MTVSGGFLIKDTAVLLSSFRGIDLRTLLTATKHLALNQCHWGVAPPRTFWAAQRATRRGRYRPSCVFCPRFFLAIGGCIAFVLRRLRERTTERERYKSA